MCIQRSGSTYRRHGYSNLGPGWSSMDGLLKQPPVGDEDGAGNVSANCGRLTGNLHLGAGMKMRRSRRSKKIIEIGVWSPETSSGPSYEAFTIPTPREFPSAGAPDTSLAGRKRPASDAERVQDSAPCATTHVIMEGSESDGDSTCQDGDLASPVQHAPSTAVKQTVLRLSALGQPPATLGEPPSVNYGEAVKNVRTEADSQHEMHRPVWTDCTESRQNDHYSHPDLQSPTHNTNAIPTVRILHRPFQTSCDRGLREESTEAYTESYDDSGGCIGNLPPIDESRCVLDSSNGRTRCGGFGHELPARKSTCCFSHQVNPSWIMNANVCRGCPVRSNPPMCSCNACAAIRFPPCSFQRGVPSAVRYYVEPMPPSQMKPYPSRMEPPARCQRMDEQNVDVDAGRGQNLPSAEGHTYGSHGNDVLVYPPPWVHEGRTFPGNPAMGVNWAPESATESQPRQSVRESQPRQSATDCQPRQSATECQPRQSAMLAESHMPEPVYPPAHYSDCNFSADMDMDMDTQLHLEEEIAHEILLLSQKLANLQARYGSRRPVHNNTNPAVLSCPQTPLLLDDAAGPQKDVKSNPRATHISQSMKGVDSRPATSSTSSTVIHRQSEEKKLGVRTTKVATSTSSNRGSDSGTVKNPCRTGSRGSGCQAPAQGEEKVFVAESGKPSRNSQMYLSPYRRRRERHTEAEHVDEQCSYSDDMKDRLRTGGANVQGYPNGNKRFDWVKTLRFGGAGVRDNQGCTHQTKDSSLPQKEFGEADPETWLRDSGDNEIRDTKTVSRSVQAGGGASPVSWTPREGETESRLKRRPNCSAESRNVKRTSSPEDMRGLDSRITHHLLKAGLRRAPSLWKSPSNPRPVPNNALRQKKKTFGSRSPRRDGGKRLRTRTPSDLNLMAFPVKALHEVKFLDKKESEEEVRTCEDAQWQREVADYEAEYETFVENSEDGTLHDTLNSEEYTSTVNREVPTSSEEEAQKRCPSSVSTQEKARLSDQEKARLSEAPVMSLAKTPPVTKRTFIRCVELVVASKKKNQLSKINGRKANSGGGYPCRRVDCAELEDCYVKAHANGVAAGAQAEQNVVKEPPSSMVVETEPEMKTAFHDSFRANMTKLPFLSSDLAERLKAQWEELIDALEKERLELPKIKTGGLEVTWSHSPRDSGCVKRIAEQMKSLRKVEKKDAHEKTGLRKGRFSWIKVEQKQEVVF